MDPHINDDSDTAALETSIESLNTSVYDLIDAVRTLSRRTTLHKFALIIIVLLVMGQMFLGVFGYWYMRDSDAREREEFQTEQVLLENTLYSGCRNAVDAQNNAREELLAFGRYLGNRGGLPSAEIDAELSTIVQQFDQLNPPRDCDAEAHARAEARREG